MLKIYNTRLLKITTIFCFLFSAFTTQAQIFWDGGGDGTSWNDPMNWDEDIVPTADSLVNFTMDAVVTGTAPDGAAAIFIGAGRTVTLDLDLTLSNDIERNCLGFGSNVTFNFGTDGSNRTFNLSAPSNRNGLATSPAQDSVFVTVAAGTTVNCLTGNNGMNNNNGESSITNNGTIVCASTLNNGMRTSIGDIINNGTIEINNVGGDGIKVQNEGNFENTSTINLTQALNDGIDMNTGGNFVNAGTINVVMDAAAVPVNNGISVGTDMDELTTSFTNSATGVINVDGGSGLEARGVNIYNMGTFTNAGTMTFTGGNLEESFYNRGITTNENGALIDLGEGRFVARDMFFTNNGLIKSSYAGGAGIMTFAIGTATNNAFYRFTTSNNFASPQGTVVDNGIDLTDETRTTIDAAGSCMIDIAEQAYEYFSDAASVGTTDDTGGLTFGTEVFTSSTVTLTNVYEDVVLTVENICDDAVITSVFDINKNVTALSVYPSLLANTRQLAIDLTDLSAENYQFNIVNQTGQPVKNITAGGGNITVVDLENLAAGFYYLQGQDGKNYLTAKFVVVE